MKRIFSFVLSALLAVTFTTAHAQQNIFIWKDGNISVKSVADIDSITTSVGSWLFNIHTSAPTSVTTNTLEASISVSYADNVQSLSQTPEVGVCFSSEEVTPIYFCGHKRLGTSVRSYDFTLYNLDPGTTYFFRGYVKLGDKVFYGNVKSVMTFGEKPTSSTYTLINGHKFVDLGLPSGLLWACTNIGVPGSSSLVGYYFAWGETEPKLSDYSWSTYKWGDDNMTKYNYSDGKKTLDAEDDAATVNWGAPCRMPDSSEFEELYNKCDWSWKSNYNGTSGYLVTGPNGNTIFLPVSGGRYNNVLSNPDSYGNYWSRSLYSNYNARYLFFRSSRIYPTEYNDRYCGYPVRPVADFGEKPSSYHIYYMVGELTGWDASNKDFAFYPESNTVHSYTAQFTGAAGLKIWMKDDFGNWDTAYGAIFDGDDSESGSLTQSGAGTIVCPEPGAYYTLTVDFANMSYEWTKVADQNPTTYYNVSLIGGFNNWSADYDLTQVIPHNWHTVFTLESATELKFRANHSWEVDWGDGGDINKKEYGKGSIYGNNINCTAGTYDVFFNDITGEYLFVVK